MDHGKILKAASRLLNPILVIFKTCDIFLNEQCHARPGAGIQGKMHSYFVYIMASKRNGTLYVGVTSDLSRRMYEHQSGSVPGFTKKYEVKMLVYYEAHADINLAIAREKRLKRWDRKWKLDLIEEFNPEWEDLSLKLNN